MEHRTYKKPEKDKVYIQIKIWKHDSKSTLDHIGADGRIILKLILKKEGLRVWIGLIWLRILCIDGL
jgi:hypothetical protein